MADDLALVLAKLTSLEQVVKRIERASHMSTVESRLILAIADAARGERGELVSFTSRELLRRGRTAPALRAAIFDACGDLDARVLGHKLLALSKAPIAGFELTSDGVERGGRTWELKVAQVARPDLAGLIAPHSP